MLDQWIVYAILIVAVLIFVGMMVKDWRSSARQKSNVLQTDRGKGGLELTLPLRLQAYERLVVFLERIRLQALVRRLSNPGLSVQEIHILLIGTVRSEYEHNVSQQIYVSIPAWEAVTTAKEQLIRHIHSVASEFSAEGNSNEFRKALLRLSMQEDNPVDVALQVLNSESKKLLKETGAR